MGNWEYICHIGLQFKLVRQVGVRFLWVQLHKKLLLIILPRIKKGADFLCSVYLPLYVNVTNEFHFQIEALKCMAIIVLHT